MSRVYPPPPVIELIAWRGEITTLAARLRMNPEELLNRLHRLTHGAHKSPLKVEVALINSGPLFGALRRKLDPQTMSETVY